jgi:hypothetical protein
MRQILTFFMLMVVLLACKKSKDDSDSATLKVALVSPANGSTVQTGKEVQFSWSSSSSNTTVPVTHKIKVVEITGDQSPEQALRTNKPHFEKDSLKEQSVVLPYSAGSPGLIVGKKYSWGITSSQKGLTSTGGESAASMFTVVPRQ